MLANIVALPLCQSPLGWRDVGTNLGLLWWEGAGAVVSVVAGC